ncbi:uncharacterized protein EV420DRAFT_1480124 [Desarmillaria tabescens]|uniref:Uncharacterized protein n=1 Tax=Armillaria tabescens TaxID=1929756 RepID=A0AA39KB77_ARMTA|nr:uncharacterized protein EV420DRAFT_1480124 [Desarmillaria tabescens]KAK0457942.1 hypothetical protein EV420DRAFT_1480124 [Desarmillaria tabescens]
MIKIEFRGGFQVSIGIEGTLICHDAQNVVVHRPAGGKLFCNMYTYTAVDYRMMAMFIRLLTVYGMSVYRPSLGKLFRQTERARYPYDGTRITVLYGDEAGSREQRNRRGEGQCTKIAAFVQVERLVCDNTNPQREQILGWHFSDLVEIGAKDWGGHWDTKFK